jgi:putative transposase
MKKSKIPKSESQALNINAQFEFPQTGGLMSLLQFGSQTLLSEAIKAEITEYLGRSFYQHSMGNEKIKGYRHGFRKTTIDTPVGPVTYDRPRVHGAEDFQSQFHVPHMRRPQEFADQICDMYVNGVSTRKIKNSLKSVTGEKIKLSKSTVSRITKSLVLEFKDWRNKDLSNLNISYLFFDAIRVGMRVGGSSKDAIMIAYAILENGSFQVLSIDISHSESNKSWGRFATDLKQRGLKDPILCISDGNQGLINAIESNFPTSLRQRCVKHKMENILDAIPKENHKELRRKLNSIFYGATSLEQAKLFIKEFKKNYAKKYPSATAILETDLDQCLTFYLFPRHHWLKIRTSNKLERLNLEIRRRLNVIGRHPSEEGCLALVYQVSKNYSFPQQRVQVNDLVKKLWEKIKLEKTEMIAQLELDLYAA